MEAPHTQLTMKDSPVSWSEGHGALAVLSKCKFLSRILTLSFLPGF